MVDILIGKGPSRKMFAMYTGPLYRLIAMDEYDNRIKSVEVVHDPKQRSSIDPDPNIQVQEATDLIARQSSTVCPNCWLSPVPSVNISLAHLSINSFRPFANRSAPVPLCHYNEDCIAQRWAAIPEFIRATTTAPVQTLGTRWGMNHSICIYFLANKTVSIQWPCSVAQSKERGIPCLQEGVQLSFQCRTGPVLRPAFNQGMDCLSPCHYHAAIQNVTVVENSDNTEEVVVSSLCYSIAAALGLAIVAVAVVKPQPHIKYSGRKA